MAGRQNGAGTGSDIREAVTHAAPVDAVHQPQEWGRYRSYLLFLLLVLINALSYADRHLLPAFASQISADLELSRQQFGLLTGFAFVSVYAVSGPLMGMLADRYNPSRVIAICLVIWSVMTCFTGMAKNFLHILLPRMAIGVGEAALHPSAAGILSRIFDAKNRATVFGLFFMGSHVGMGLAYWLAGNVGETTGWRQLFFILGALGILLSGVLLLAARGMPEIASGEAEHPASPVSSGKPTFRSMSRDLVTAFRYEPNFRYAVLGMSLLHMLYASSQFMQLWLVADKGMAQSVASSLYGTVYLAIAIPSGILGGLAADWFCRRFNSSRAMFVVLVMLCSGPLLLLFRVTPASQHMFLVGMAASVFLLSFPYGAIFSLVLDNTPENIQSTAVGFTMFVANVLVIGTGTYLVGLGADLMGDFGVAEPLTRTLLCADTITLCSGLIYFKLHLKLKRQTKLLARAPAQVNG